MFSAIIILTVRRQLKSPVGDNKLTGFPYFKEFWMVTDYQVRILMKLINQNKTPKTTASKAGMSEKTARK